MVDAGGIEYTVSVETDAAFKAADQFDKSLDKVQKTSDRTDREINKLNTSMSKLATSIGAVLSVAAIANEFKKAVATTKEFNQTISNLSALTGLTGPALDDLANKARAIGAVTTLSATQAAGAMQLIGSKAPELLKSAEALDKVTQSAVVLAEASGSDMRVSADILTGVMNQFNMTAEETDRIINTLAAGAKNGASSVESTAAALARAGTQANMSGVSIEQFTALVQTLAKGEITASDAGTALRNTLLILDTAVDKNLRPSVVGMSAALANLEKAQKGGMDMLKMFGRENITAANILIKNRDEYERVTAAVTDTNEAYEQQALRTNNLVGDIAGLNSAYEDLQITVGQLADSSLRTLTQELTKLLIYMGDGEKGSNGLATALEYASVAAQSVAAIIAGRLAMSMVAFGTAQAAAIASTIRNNQAQALAADAAVRRAAAEKAGAMATLGTAKSSELAARGTASHTAAVNALTAAKSRALATTQAYNVAIAASGTVATTTGIAVAALGRAMTFLGGPLGLIMLAATAFYAFSGSADAATTSLNNIDEPLDSVVKRLGAMNELAREADLRALAGDVDDLTVSYQELARETANALNDKLVGKFGLFGKAASDTVPAIDAVRNAANNMRSGAEVDFNAVASVVRNLSDEHADLKVELLDMLNAMQTARGDASALAQRHVELTAALGATGDAATAAKDKLDDLNETMRSGSQAATEYAARTSRALEDSLDGSALGKLMRDIRDNADTWKDATKEQMDAAVNAAIAVDKHEASIKAQANSMRAAAVASREKAAADREAKVAADALLKDIEDNDKKLNQLDESLRRVGMSARDVAIAQAAMSLNDSATDAQIAKAKELAGAYYDAKEQVTLLAKAKELDVEGSTRDKYEQEKTDLQEMLELKMISEEEYRQYTLDAESTLKERLMALDEERFAAQSKGHELLINSLNDMGSHATNAFMQFATGAKTGKDAVLAMGQAIAQSVIRQMVDMGVQMAINAVKERLFAAQSAATAATTGAAIATAYAPAAAAASVATGGGAAVAGSTALAGAVPAMMAMFGGGRQYGGGVEGNKFYKVNEGGAPEIFKGADGNQYMMPNQRGEVVSNKDATGGGGSVFNVTLHVEASEGMSTGDARDLGNEMSDAFVAGVRGVISGELESGGAIWHAVQG